MVIPVPASGNVDVRYQRLVQFAFGHDVEHGAFFAVIDAGLFSIVALFVVGFDFFHHAYGQVLHRHFGIAFEEVLAVDEEFLDFLTVPCNFSVLAHLHSGEEFDKCLQRGTFRCAVGRGVEDGGVLHLFHLLHRSSNLCRAECDFIAFESDWLNVDGVLVHADANVLCSRFEADVRGMYDEGAAAVGLQDVVAQRIGKSAGHQGAVRREQSHGGQFHRALVALADDCAAYKVRLGRRLQNAA